MVNISEELCVPFLMLSAITLGLFLGVLVLVNRQCCLGSTSDWLHEPEQCLVSQTYSSQWFQVWLLAETPPSWLTRAALQKASGANLWTGCDSLAFWPLKNWVGWGSILRGPFLEPFRCSVVPPESQSKIFLFFLRWDHQQSSVSFFKFFFLAKWEGFYKCLKNIWICESYWSNG